MTPTTGIGISSAGAPKPPTAQNESWIGRSRGRIWLAVLTVFIGGILLGIAGTVEYQMYKRQHRADSGLARFKPRVIRHLSQVLHLTPEQRRVIEPLVSQAEAALLDLRMKHQPRVEEIVHTAAMQIKATLTADQQIAFDELLTALQARWRKDRMYADQQLAPHTPR